MVERQRKHIIITGGGGGIGSVTARRFAAAGAYVSAFSRDADVVTAIASAVTAEWSKTTPFCCDIASRADIDAALEGDRAVNGPVPVLANNSGWEIFTVQSRSAASLRLKSYQVRFPFSQATMPVSWQARS